MRRRCSAWGLVAGVFRRRIVRPVRASGSSTRAQRGRRTPAGHRCSGGQSASQTARPQKTAERPRSEQSGSRSHGQPDRDWRCNRRGVRRLARLATHRRQCDTHHWHGGERGPLFAAGRGAGSSAGPDRHAALRRGQGQPIFPARFQSRSRHRSRDQCGRYARQHADPRAWAGLRRHQFPDPRADPVGQRPQGTVLRRPGRLRIRRRRGDRLCQQAAAQHRGADLRQLRLPSRIGRGIDRRGCRHAAGGGRSEQV